MISRFLVIIPVPVQVYTDPPFMWFSLDRIWVEKLQSERGTRVPGPLDMRELQLGEISAHDLAEYIFSDPDTAAVFKVTGPAIPPDLPEA